RTGRDAIASMLLGLMSGGSLRTEPALSDQVIYGALYVQDDWHVNSRMTLNLGLRWDSDRPFTERYNRTSWFDPTVALPLQVPGVAPLRGGLVFAGRDGNPRGNNNPDNNNFAPRVGLAYKLTNDLVVRTGFGIFYNPTTGQAPSSGTTGALSFDSQTDVISSIDAGRTPFTTLSNPFPNSFNVPTNGAQGPLTMIGQSISDVLRGDRASYNMQWNFDVQYGLKQDMLLDVAYAGNSGVKLMAAPQWNQLADQYLALGDQLTAKVANPFYGFIPTTSTLGQATTTLGQLLRPYPQLTGLQQLRDMMAHSTYHSLQIKFRKRYRNGLQFLAAYTWSKMIDDASGLAAGFTNNNDRRLDRSLSSSDIPHHLVFNYQYELPFGAGRRFLSQGKLLDAVFGGWRLNGITTIQSGPPVPIFSAANTTNSFGGVQRPNSAGISSETPGGAKDRIDHFFNTAAFLIPPKYAFGNVGRYLPDNRAPGLQNWDLSVLKDIPIQESRRLEFRAEFFNLFNNVNFGGPATVFGQPQFGTIRQTEPARIIQFALKFFY
ncbi:MAG: TonB-dependent receptor, partial [Acidobacteria bacterium]|nr:TonB-dependent receptor [Acidobacteriota bacterium]